MVIEVRAVNAREIVLAERLAQIEAQHFGTDGSVESANFDVLIGNGVACVLGGGGSNGSRHGKTLGRISFAERRIGAVR
jgi:hypothetical protein